MENLHNSKIEFKAYVHLCNYYLAAMCGLCENKHDCNKGSSICISSSRITLDFATSCPRVERSPLLTSLFHFHLFLGRKSEIGL